MKNKKTIRKTDVYLMGILLVVFAALFLFFQLVIFSGTAEYAYIYYDVADPIVTIDFSKQKIIVHYEQEVPSEYLTIYPIVNEQGEDGFVEITLLGDYKIDGIRQEVVITVDYNQSRIKIKEEESPQNICSKQGWSTAAPLICLPNKIRVEFDSTNSDIDFIQ
ncbi:MAG: NusG domain II-containing protein [Acholeplasmataceae bacterium]